MRENRESGQWEHKPGVTRERGWRSTGNNWRLRSEVIRRQQATVRHYLLTNLFRGHCCKKIESTSNPEKPTKRFLSWGEVSPS